MKYAFYDRDGLNVVISSNEKPPGEWSVFSPVEEGTKPGTTWFDAEACAVKPSEAVDAAAVLELPVIVDIGAPVVGAVPAGCVVFVDGRRAEGGTFAVPTDAAGVVKIDLMGRLRGEAWVDVRGYVQHRVAAYGDIGEQLDMLWHDPETWRAHVAAVKAANPKPDPKAKSRD